MSGECADAEGCSADCIDLYPGPDPWRPYCYRDPRHVSATCKTAEEWQALIDAGAVEGSTSMDETDCGDYAEYYGLDEEEMEEWTPPETDDVWYEYGPNNEIGYASDESNRLSERFGSVYTAAEIIENELASMALNLINSSVRVEYNFKKVRQALLSEDELTSFETEEGTSTTTVGTTLTATDLTTTTIPEGYEGY